MWKLACALFFLLSIARGLDATRNVSYAGYTAYQVKVNTQEDAEAISTLKGKAGYDFWNEIDMTNHKVDIMAAPDKKDEFQSFLQDKGLAFIVTVEDVGKMIEHLEGDSRRSLTNFAGNVGHYMSYDEIVLILQKLSTIQHPKLPHPIMKLEKIGKTFENRDMYLCKISSDPYAMKPIILLEGGMHAREWAGPSVLLYIVWELTANYTQNKRLLDFVDFYIVPMSNPDGYEYSRTVDRMWRKTRSDTGGGCKGVDGNRNFDFHWGGAGTSDDPCSDIYKGPAPFSEKETRAVMNVGLEYTSRLLGYVAVHSYGGFMLYPWGYSTGLPDDWQQLNECAESFAKAVKGHSGTQYTYGSSGRTLYAAAGGSDDWFKGELQIPFAYTLEIAASGREGFRLPEAKLPTVALETLVGFEGLNDCILRYTTRRSSSKGAKSNPNGGE